MGCEPTARPPGPWRAPRETAAACRTRRPSGAEKVGFEPTDRVTPVNALAGRPIRPLWHFSVGESRQTPSGNRTVHVPRSLTSLAGGTVAEWTIAPALKADDLHGSGGSNPPRSADGSVDVHRRPRRFTEVRSELAICPLGPLHAHRRFCSATPAATPAMRPDRFAPREVNMPRGPKGKRVLGLLLGRWNQLQGPASINTDHATNHQVDGVTNAVPTTVAAPSGWAGALVRTYKNGPLFCTGSWKYNSGQLGVGSYLTSSTCTVHIHHAWSSHGKVRVWTGSSYSE